MGAKGYAGLAATGLLALTLSACGSSQREYDAAQVETMSDDVEYDLPARYGLYALADGQLGRLDGEKSFQVETWESRSSLGSDVAFIIFDRSLGDRSVRLDDAVKLRRVAHVRNDVAASGAATPLQKDIWVVADLPEFAVPLDFQPIHGSPEMVKVIPTRPLQPGLYALQFHLGESSIAGRFGVKWSKIDKNQYAAANCVDRYAGSRPAYKLCSDLSAALPKRQISQQPLLQQQPLAQQPQQFQQRPLQQQSWPQQNTLQQQLIQPYKTPPAVPQAPEQPAPKQQALQQQAPQQQLAPMPPAHGLKLRDVQAARTSDQGVAILTVQGVIVNTTKEPRRVPPLMATVRDLKGTELDRWTFTAEISELPPGGTTGFRTETIYPTSQSTNVAVTFASDSTAQAQ
jgi:hypothetical protein